MGNILFRIKHKKELKRSELCDKINDFSRINSLNGNDKDLELIKYIEKVMNLYKYKTNKDYLLIGRKKALMNELETILNEYDSNKYVFSKNSEMMRVLLQFITEGNRVYPEDVDKSLWKDGKYIDGKDFAKLREITDRYTLNGIICLEEKNDIISMIQKVKKNLE